MSLSLGHRIHKMDDKSVVYGGVTVFDIVEEKNIVLNGTIVQERVESEGRISATDAKIYDVVVVKKGLEAEKSIFQSIQARKAVLLDSSVFEDIKIRWDFKATRCPILGDIIAPAGHVDIDKSDTIRSIHAATLTLTDSTVLGDVTSLATDNYIKNSKIFGVLTISIADNIEMDISGGEINTIHVKCPEDLDDSEDDAQSSSCSKVDAEDTPHLKNIKHFSSKKIPQQTLVLRDCIVKNVVFSDGIGAVKLEGNSPCPTIFTGKIQKKPHNKSGSKRKITL